MLAYLAKSILNFTFTDRSNPLMLDLHVHVSSLHVYSIYMYVNRVHGIILISGRPCWCSMRMSSTCFVFYSAAHTSSTQWFTMLLVVPREVSVIKFYRLPRSENALTHQRAVAISHSLSRPKARAIPELSCML